MKKAGIVLVAICMLSAQADELSISGFGSVVGAKVTGGDGYVAHYPTMAAYDDQFDITEESRFGLQFQKRFDDSTSATAQITARGSLDWEPKLEWFYFTSDLTNTTRVQAGRMRLPAYLYSDYMDVGYAYNFIRVPGDAYSVDAVNYNGIAFTFKHAFSGVDTSLQIYGGREHTDPNKLMSYIRGFEHNRDYTNLKGAVLSATVGSWTFRTTYLTTDITETALDPDSVPPFVDPPGEFNIKFNDYAILYDANPFSVAVEYNEYEYYKSWLASFAYVSGKLTTHLTVSQFDLNEAWESHDSVAVGIRYEYRDNVALKLQLDRFNDTGENPFTGADNTICHCEDGDVMVFSAGADFVF